jgi:hypothetical protein
LICNIGKFAGMLYISYGALSEPLITVGDAVSSFLDNTDPTTSGLCLSTRDDFIAVLAGPRVDGHRVEWPHDQGLDPCPKEWQPVKRTWFNAASTSRWCWSLFP